MSAVDSDILAELDKSEMLELRNRYKNVQDAFYVYTMINLVIKWKEKMDHTVIITSPGNTWRQDGSIVVIFEFGTPMIFLYSFDKTYYRVKEGLMKTKRINRDEPCYFIFVPESCVNIMVDTIEKLNRKVSHLHEAYHYTLSTKKVQAIEINCPSELYVNTLNKTHAEQINNLWPHKYENSVKDVTKFIENNIGFGLFTKSDDKLIAWVLQGPLGHINLLQTEEAHKGKGYGKMMTYIMAKYIADSGHVPAATVLVKNTASVSIFEKLGFEIVDKLYTFETEVVCKH